MGKVLQFKTLKQINASEEEDRLNNIKASLDKITKLMNELRRKKND
jgi:hypothetical protein